MEIQKGAVAKSYITNGFLMCGPAVYFSWPMVISNSVNEFFVAV